MDRDLAKGIGNITCPNSGQCDVGIGQDSKRRYKADKVIAVRGVTNEIDTRNKIPGVYGVGTCTIRFFITGNPNPAGQAESCPGCTFKRFSLDYTLSYQFNKNDKVTDFKVIKRAIQYHVPQLTSERRRGICVTPTFAKSVVSPKIFTFPRLFWLASPPGFRRRIVKAMM